jgi:uncharacterized protein (TIGR03437 family)
MVKPFSLCVLVLSGTGIAVGQVTLNTTPTRIVGHAKPEGNANLPNYNPNLVEGRELDGPTGLALDNSASPPTIYVADTVNNRVLAWKNATGFANGAAADLVIGQPDFLTTNPAGPGTTFSAGLNAPTGLAVRSGDLFIVDSGNNRILRFPKPFSNAGQQQIPNLIIGQPSLSTRNANYPNGQPTANGILTYTGSGSAFTAGLAFDSSGNLWFTDPGNRRVLRYPTSALSSGSNFPAADFVLGLPTTTDFTDAGTSPGATLNCSNNNPCAYTTTQFYIPSAVAFDAAGRLYVADADPTFTANRVLVFTNLNTTTAKIIGLYPQGTTNPSQDLINKTFLSNPSGIVFLSDPAGGQDIAVVDSFHSRILVFPPYEKWTDPLVASQAIQVIGQNGDFSNTNRNNAPFGATYFPPPTAGTLAFPSAAAVLNSQLFVVDTSNNRVVVLPIQNSGAGAATSVLGQLRFDAGSINLIEGKEFQFLWQGGADAGIAIDSTGSTPHLYVADPGNNRILGFRDLRSINADSQADIVIGQPDFQTAVCNYSSSSPTHGGDPNAPNQSSLCGPTGVLVDGQGNLYAADSLNGRVVRFPAPFSYQGKLEPADVVLGKPNFTSQTLTDPSQFNMARPYGLAFSGANGLVVSDVSQNRVLYFPTSNGTFTSADNGKAATKVFGQGQFLSITPGSDSASLNGPRHVATDTNGQIYVADAGNNRVQIFPDPNNPNTPLRGATSLISITDNLTSPHGVYVSPSTGEVWVTDTGNSSPRAKRYVRFDQLALNGTATTIIPAAFPTLAVAQDQFGDLFLADYSHRIAIYFPGLQALNWGNQLVTRALAPGVVGIICAPNSNVVNGVAGVEGCKSGATAFGNTQETQTPGFPLSTTLGDTQVFFNGQATPLYYASSSQINFVVPMGKNAGDVPTSGTADLQVIRASTGQVLAAGSVPMSPASPGIGQLNYTGSNRQAAVLNSDNSVNSSTNATARGSVIQIFATGQGFTPGAPTDGSQPTSPVSTPQVPDVLIGACRVDDSSCTAEPGEHVKYSGLSSYPGGWQINVQIPQNVPPGIEPIVIGMNGASSTDANSGFRMVIYVK